MGIGPLFSKSMFDTQILKIEIFINYYLLANITMNKVHIKDLVKKKIHIKDR